MSDKVQVSAGITVNYSSGALRFKEHVTPYRLVRCEDLESLRSMMVNGAFACAFEGDHSILVPIPDAGSHAGDEWACFRIDADIPLGTVGIAAEVTGVLAAADISLLVMSGYRTDYFLVRDSQRQPARDALTAAGHHVDVHRESEATW